MRWVLAGGPRALPGHAGLGWAGGGERRRRALWESKDGAFQAYISCDLPAGALKNLKPAAIAVTKQGMLTRLACSYPEGILFTHRTKAQCKVLGDGNCAADPAACKASCD